MPDTTDSTPTPVVDPYVALGRVLGSTIAAQLVECVAERGRVNADTAALCAWAADSVDVDDLWDGIGPLIDSIEADALAVFGNHAPDPG